MTRQWETLREYDEIKYEFYEGIAKVTINRPEVRNAFTPKTVAEMIDAFSRARDDQNISVIILTGEGDKAFCSGGDQKTWTRWLCRRRPNPTFKCIRFTTFNPCHS